MNITRVALDLAKQAIHVYATDVQQHVVVDKAMSRQTLIVWFA